MSRIVQFVMTLSLLRKSSGEEEVEKDEEEVREDEKGIGVKIEEEEVRKEKSGEGEAKKRKWKKPKAKSRKEAKGGFDEEKRADEMVENGKESKKRAIWKGGRTTNETKMEAKSEEGGEGVELKSEGRNDDGKAMKVDIDDEYEKRTLLKIEECGDMKTEEGSGEGSVMSREVAAQTLARAGRLRTARPNVMERRDGVLEMAVHGLVSNALADARWELARGLVDEDPVWKLVDADMRLHGECGPFRAENRLFLFLARVRKGLVNLDELVEEMNAKERRENEQETLPKKKLSFIQRVKKIFSRREKRKNADTDDEKKKSASLPTPTVESDSDVPKIRNWTL